MSRKDWPGVCNGMTTPGGRAEWLLAGVEGQECTGSGNFLSSWFSAGRSNSPVGGHPRFPANWPTEHLGVRIGCEN